MICKWKTSDRYQKFFQELELLVWKVFHKDAPEMTCAELTCNLKEKEIQRALAGENVQFHWCLLVTDIEDEKATIMLKMIASHTAKSPSVNQVQPISIAACLVSSSHKSIIQNSRASFCILYFIKRQCSSIWDRSRKSCQSFWHGSVCKLIPHLLPLCLQSCETPLIRPARLLQDMATPSSSTTPTTSSSAATTVAATGATPRLVLTLVIPTAASTSNTNPRPVPDHVHCGNRVQPSTTAATTAQGIPAPTASNVG